MLSFRRRLYSLSIIHPSLVGDTVYYSGGSGFWGSGGGGDDDDDDDDGDDGGDDGDDGGGGGDDDFRKTFQKIIKRKLKILEATGSTQSSDTSTILTTSIPPKSKDNTLRPGYSFYLCVVAMVLWVPAFIFGIIYLKVYR
uniref:Uncharacterized protein n=1 Tax=Acrobeloides nanus TaxID=290746 RepID=A0A914EEJ4_9BILA